MSTAEANPMPVEEPQARCQLKGNPKACGAKCKNGGHPCPNPGMANGRCWIHGGKSPSGPDHYRYSGRRPRQGKHGEAYRNALDCPELLHITPDVADIDAKIDNLIRRVNAGESERKWDELQDLIRDSQDELKKGTLDPSAMLERARAIIASRYESDTLENKIEALQHSRAKLIDAEMRRQVAAQDMVDKRSVALLVEDMRQALAIIDDPTLRAEIRARFRELRSRHVALTVLADASDTDAEPVSNAGQDQSQNPSIHPLNPH